MRLKAISLFVIASFFVVRSGSSAPASVQSMPTSVEITFELNAKVRFCYDKDPEIIYFRHDASSNRTIVEARSLDNRTRALFDFPGLANPRSLSCSIDGSTIAALSGDNGHLYIFQSSQLSAYEIQRPTLDNVKGFYSLLSPDGKMIGLYGDPVHRSGADAIANMKVFKVARGDSVFFDEDAAYVDEEHEIARYQYLDGGWGRQGSISKPLDYSVIEVSRCGNRLVASLSDDEHLGLLDPEKREAGRDDWLKRMGSAAFRVGAASAQPGGVTASPKPTRTWAILVRDAIAPEHEGAGAEIMLKRLDEGARPSGRERSGQRSRERRCWMS